MRNRSFLGRVSYFEQRARKLPPGHRRWQLERAAEHYRARARASGEIPSAFASSEAGDGIPPRRRRLMELFREHGNAPERS
jgi:hypothetical protein